MQGEAVRYGRVSSLALLAAAAFATPLPAGTHPLVDRHLLARTAGVERVVEAPRKLGVIVDGERDHNYQPYLTVLREGGVFRLWYAAKSDEQLAIGYMTSTNGIDFERPHRELPVPEGYQYGASLIRDGDGYLFPYFAKSAGTTSDLFKGISIARSTDGFTWRAANPVPMYQLREVGLLRAPGDITSVIRFRGRYLLYVKMNGTGYPGVTPHMPFPGYRRLVGVMTSDDGVAWSLPQRIVSPDARDGGVTEFYGLGGVVERGGLLVGFLRILRDDLPADAGGPVEGIGNTVLAWSRDGVTWERDGVPFLERGAAGAWDHAMAWADAQVDVGNRTLVYYGGYARGHKVSPLTDRKIGVATMVRDRYVGWRGTGTLTTRRLRLAGALTLNASVSTPIRVTARSSTGKVRTCRVPAGDFVARRVPCATGTTTVTLRYTGTIYAFGVR